VSSSSDRGRRPLASSPRETKVSYVTVASSPALGYITPTLYPNCYTITAIPNIESFMQTLETYLYARFSEYSTRYAAILVLISLLTDLTAGQQTALITLAAALAGTPDKGAKQ
jgi:hypothetical protein